MAALAALGELADAANLEHPTSSPKRRRITRARCTARCCGRDDNPVQPTAFAPASRSAMRLLRPHFVPVTYRRATNACNTPR
jgi:hypothetical protein